MPDKIDGEIEVNLLEDIVKTLPHLTAIHSADNCILIHGMGDKPKSFYRQLRQNKNAELLWTGWSSNIWWTYLLSFIPGQSGLTKVLNRQHIDSLYLNIGRQSMCGLYFIPNNKIDSVLEDIKKTRGRHISDSFANEQNYFLLTVDFDFHGGDRDGQIFYRQLLMGDSLNTEIKKALTKTK